MSPLDFTTSYSPIIGEIPLASKGQGGINHPTKPYKALKYQVICELCGATRRLIAFKRADGKRYLCHKCGGWGC